MLKQLLRQKEQLKAASQALLAKIEPEMLRIENQITAIDEQIETFLEPIIKANRQSLQKDTGIITFEVQGVEVKHDLPKRVKWDQIKLAATVKRITDSGADPSEYVKISYEVPESKYKAWPQAIKDIFVDARTLELGKPKLAFSVKADAEQEPELTAISGGKR